MASVANATTTPTWRPTRRKVMRRRSSATAIKNSEGPGPYGLDPVAWALGPGPWLMSCAARQAPPLHEYRQPFDDRERDHADGRVPERLAQDGRPGRRKRPQSEEHVQPHEHGRVSGGRGQEHHKSRQRRGHDELLA